MTFTNDPRKPSTLYKYDWSSSEFLFFENPFEIAAEQCADRPRILRKKPPAFRRLEPEVLQLKWSDYLLFKRDSRKPPKMGPFMVSFSYYSHIFRDSYWGSLKIPLNCWWFRNPVNQLMLAVHPIVYRLLLHLSWWRMSSINSIQCASRDWLCLICSANNYTWWFNVGGLVTVCFFAF